MAAVLFSSSSAWGACPASLEALRVDGADAIELYCAFGFQGFRQEAALAHEEVECVTGILAPDDAAAVHTVRVLDAWLEKDNKGVQAAVRGLYAADPGFELDLELAPEGSRLWALFVSAKAIGPGEELPVDGRLTVDGVPNQDRVPTQRAAVVQRIADSGVSTGHLAGGDMPDELRSLPAAVLMAPTISTDLPTASKRKGPRTSRTLLISGVSAMAVGAAGLSIAAISQSNFDALGDPSAESYSEARSLRNTNRITGIGGYAFGAAGAGLALSAVFVGAW